MSSLVPPIFGTGRTDVVPAIQKGEYRHTACIIGHGLIGPLEETAVNDSPLTPLQSTTTDAFAKVFTDEETLVADDRANLSPSQQVEQKLIGMLKASPLLVSHVQRRLKPGPR